MTGLAQLRLGLALLILLIGLAPGCGGAEPSAADALVEAPSEPVVVSFEAGPGGEDRLGDAARRLHLERTADAPVWWVLDSPYGPSEAVVTVEAEVLEGRAALRVDDQVAEAQTENAFFFGARPWTEGLRLGVVPTRGPARIRITLTVRARPPEAVIGRSLAWTQPALLDDSDVVGLGRLLEVLAGDEGGPFLDRFLRSFARTAHSERPALAQLADDLREDFGEPAMWPLDELPFRVTGVHNRLDLRTDRHCGELRVSLAATLPELGPFHLLFIFEQPASPEDRAVTGTVHCEERAARWAQLAEATSDQLETEARAILDEMLQPERFVLVETLERTVGAWEWRQWAPEDGDAMSLVNPPLFQTLDVPRLNRDGPERRTMLRFIEANAEPIMEQRAHLPAELRPRSAQAIEGIERASLDLSGLPGSLDATRIETQLDRMSCPGCHHRAPTFLQTSVDRQLSPFYERELEARREALNALWLVPPPPPSTLGALQDR